MKQMILFDTMQALPDKKPIPQDIARALGFSLQRAEADDGTVYYAVQDWVAGLAHTDNPARLWSDMKRSKASRQIQLYERIVQLPYQAANGRTYQMDYADEETIYLITQRLDARGDVTYALAYFAKVLKQASDDRRNPAAAAERYQRQYIADQVARGMTEEQARRALVERIEGKDDYKRLMESIVSVCTDAPNFARIVNTEYVALFGKAAKDLEALLKSKSVRDALPELQLQYLRTAEAGLRKVLEQKGRLSNDQIIYAAKQVCQPLGVHLQSLCEALGIDHVTGSPLLKA